MKRFIMILAWGIVLCSCSTVISETSTSIGIETQDKSYNQADLIVSPNKISYTMIVKRADRKLGRRRVHEKAVALALKENGRADVMIAPQFETSVKRHKIRKIVVTGYPATYKNFTKAAHFCPNHKQ